MPDQKHTETQQDPKKDKSLKQTQQNQELREKEEKKRKIELAEEKEKKHQRDLKETEEKERIKKEQAAESNRKRCTICGKEFFPNRICVGHELGGGGSGSGDSETDEKLNKDGNTPPTFIEKLFTMAGQFGSVIM